MCSLLRKGCFRAKEKELSHEEGLALIDDLAEFGAPVILFSGGEPLIRPDLVRLRVCGSKRDGAVISTNGTLITEDKARELKDVGLSYVGVSLDGMEEINDRFRGKKGRFKRHFKGSETVGMRALRWG